MATFRVYADSRIPQLNIKKQLLPFKNIKSPLQVKSIRTPFSENKVQRTPFSENKFGLNDNSKSTTKFNLKAINTKLSKLSPNIKKSTKYENVKQKKMNTKLCFYDDLKTKSSLTAELDLDKFLNRDDYDEHIHSNEDKFCDIMELKKPTFKIPNEPISLVAPPSITLEDNYFPFFKEASSNITLPTFEFDDNEKPDFIE